MEPPASHMGGISRMSVRRNLMALADSGCAPAARAARPTCYAPNGGGVREWLMRAVLKAALHTGPLGTVLDRYGPSYTASTWLKVTLRAQRWTFLDG